MGSLQPTDGLGWEPFRQRCLAAVIGTRVNAVTSPFFDSIGEQEASFPAIQGVEALWRELSGAGDNSVLFQAAEPAVAELEARLRADEGLRARVVAAAVRCVAGVIQVRNGQPDGLMAATTAAAEVARGLDDAGRPPPEGASGWVPFELDGQRTAVQAVRDLPQPPSGDALFDLRLRAGMDSMSYRTAMEEWLAAG